METTAIKSIAHLAEALVQNQIKHVVYLQVQEMHP